LGLRALSEAIFALAVPAWHSTVHRTVNYRNYGKLQSSKIIRGGTLRLKMGMVFACS